MAIQRKMCEAPDLKFFGEDAGSLSGYASSFGNKDLGGEVVVRGAFTPSLEAFKTNGWVGLNHDWDALPIATVTDAHEDEFGLHFTADFHSHPAAQAARQTAMERLARGKSVRTSIGYKVEDSERTADALLLKSLSLFEISIVNQPMNPLAHIGMVKGETTSADEDRSLLAGLTFADATDTALATVEEWYARAKAIIDLRTKEGRTISAATLARVSGIPDSLRGHADAIDAVIALAKPKAAPNPDAQAALRELAALYREDSRRLGVPV